MQVATSETAKRAIARFESANARGGGVLIPGGHIVTCYHVLKGVLGVAPLPGMEIRASFPFAGIEGITATISDLAPELPLAQRRPSQPEDLALLTVPTDLGFAITPQSFASKPAPNGTRFVCWGFPKTGAGGTPAYGEVGDMDGNGLVHIQRTHEVEPFVQEGFSGCPIFERLSASGGGEAYGRALGICVLRIYDETAVGRFIGADEILRWLRPRLSPYPGKTPFSAAHGPLYCGHSAFVADLQEQAHEQGLVALIGLEKTGRTSLIRAGLMQVEQRRFGVIGLAEGIEDLQEECGRALGLDWRKATAERIVRELGELTQERNGVLLIVDRAEELAEPKRLASSRDFVQLLSSVARSRQQGDQRFALILVVEESRRSALDLLLRDGIPPESECAMPALGYQEIRSAIVRPAEQFGVSFAPNLVRRIINEFNWDKVTLPELASSLKRMWWAKGARSHISEQTFPGFGIERALATGESDDVAAHEDELANLRLFLEERDKRPADELNQLPRPISAAAVIELRELAEACEAQLMSPRRSEARLALERRRPELWDALRTCIADPSLAAEGLRLAGALFWYWNLDADFVSGRNMLEPLIVAQAVGTKSMPLAKACYASGTLAFLRGDMQAARTRLTQAVCMYCALHEATTPDAERWMAYALLVLGRTDDRLTRAQRREGVAVDIMGRINDGWGLALALNDLGFVTAASGQYQEACDHYGRSISLWRARKDLWGLPLALVNYGAWAIEASDWKLATEALRQANQIHGAVGDRWEMPNSIRFMAELSLRRDRPGRALAGFRQSLAAARSIGRLQLVVDSLLGIARAMIASEPDDREAAMRAAGLLGAFDAAIARNRYPITRAQRRASEQLSADLLTKLGEDDYSAEVRRGARRSWEALLDDALRD